MRAGSQKLRRLGFAAVLMLAASATPALSQTSPACGVPAALGDGWVIDSPESVGLDGARLCAIAARLKETEADVHAVVIARHGKLVFEQYFPGYDDPWGAPEGQFDFDARTKHDMRSVSKSVISLLVGIAIDRKLIADPQQPVVKFFPEYSALKTPGWDSINLRHLLTMSSGISWDEARAWTDPRNDEPHLSKDADPIRYVLAKPVEAPPDTVWNYNGGGTDLLGNIIERVSGKPFADFAREALFDPLGITDWEWKTYENGKIAPAAGLRLRHQLPHRIRALPMVLRLLGPPPALAPRRTRRRHRCRRPLVVQSPRSILAAPRRSRLPHQRPPQPSRSPRVVE